MDEPGAHFSALVAGWNTHTLSTQPRELNSTSQSDIWLLDLE